MGQHWINLYCIREWYGTAHAASFTQLKSKRANCGPPSLEVRLSTRSEEQLQCKLNLTRRAEIPSREARACDLTKGCAGGAEGESRVPEVRMIQNVEHHSTELQVVSLVFLMTEKSVLTKLGPVMESRPRLPGWQVVPTQGDANSAANTDLLPNQAAGSPVT